jgi:hypothetical protein
LSSIFRANTAPNGSVAAPLPALPAAVSLRAAELFGGGVFIITGGFTILFLHSMSVVASDLKHPGGLVEIFHFVTAYALYFTSA